ncbi:hypothetical protein [Corynebacterium sp. 13CS0277]|nr:hypothetical protein [Corynebacterium sp. 13CS0277]
MDLLTTLYVAGLISLLVYPPLGLVLILVSAIASTIDTARIFKEWLKWR